MGNALKTGFLLALLTVLVVLLGGALGGRQGMLVAFLLAGVMNFASYWFSDKIVLRMSGARPVEEAQAPGLHRVVRTLATRAGLPMPRVYVMSMDTPNAFATGRDPQHAAVAVTDGIMRILDEQELEGVIAHELAHIRNRDTLIMTVAATLAGAITYLAHMAQFAALFGGMRRDQDESPSALGAVGALVMAVLAPLAAMLVQMAISRSREYHADATGARIAGQPWGLAKALEKLEMAASMAPMRTSPATAHLFIVNPLRGGGFSSLFSTHPPVQERVARLRAMRV